MTTNPARRGIPSTARIGTHKVIPRMRKSAALEVTAIASEKSGRQEQP